jgi:uncharacterized glyoxalase superfamily protein PhnB
MNTPTNPFGLRTITPYLLVADANGAIAFMQDIFGAQLRGEPKIRDDGSTMHAEVLIGDSVVMIGEPPEEFEPTFSTFYIYVDDCDASFEKALERGAESVMEPSDFPHGDRYGGVKDPAGNIWWLVTYIGDSTSD